MFFRIIISIFAISFTFGQLLASESSILLADSLFKSKKYTEAFTLYEEIYKDGQISPAMLVKMAFIKEGLGNHTEALYYLDHYYKNTGNRKVLQKMNDLADENHLSGYDYSDYKFVVNNINKYGGSIVLGLLALSVFTLALVFYKRPKGMRALPWLALQLLLITPVMLITNNFFHTEEAIIAQNQTILMTGPSAGAEPIDYISRGNKVRVLNQAPVWSKIASDNMEGYVRSNRLLTLP